MKLHFCYLETLRIPEIKMCKMTDEPRWVIHLKEKEDPNFEMLWYHMPKMDHIQNPQYSLSYHVFLLKMIVFLET